MLGGVESASLSETFKNFRKVIISFCSKKVYNNTRYKTHSCYFNNCEAGATVTTPASAPSIPAPTMELELELHSLDLPSEGSGVLPSSSRSLLPSSAYGLGRESPLLLSGRSRECPTPTATMFSEQQIEQTSWAWAALSAVQAWVSGLP